MAALDPITGAENLIDDTLNKFIPDPVQKAAASAAVLQIIENAQSSLVQSQAGVITAEVTSSSWLTRNWRPCLMFTFMAIIANNYILAPYLQAIVGKSLTLPMPEDMWSILRIGIGGYVVGRSAEKISTTLTGTGVAQSATSAVSNLFKGH